MVRDFDSLTEAYGAVAADQLERYFDYPSPVFSSSSSSFFLFFFLFLFIHSNARPAPFYRNARVSLLLGYIATTLLQGGRTAGRQCGIVTVMEDRIIDEAKAKLLEYRWSGCISLEDDLAGLLSCCR